MSSLASAAWPSHWVDHLGLALWPSANERSQLPTHPFAAVKSVVSVPMLLWPMAHSQFCVTLAPKPVLDEYQNVKADGETRAGTINLRETSYMLN